MTLIIGPHVSIAGGYARAAKDALSVGANTFQFFTRNPRGGSARALDPKDVEALREKVESGELVSLLAHAPYTLNMASAKADVRDFARRAFHEDLKRLEILPCSLYNFHPGSHVGQGAEAGIALITDILNEVMWEDQTTTVLLEAMSGKGSEIGRDFSELRAIIDGITYTEHIGVCLDTCHIFSAGYDIKDQLDAVLEEFDRVVGLERLKALHLNDSKTPFHSNKDRHERLGEGSIGMDAFKSIVTHPALRDKPFFLETPQKNFKDYAEEITILREFTKEF